MTPIATAAQALAAPPTSPRAVLAVRLGGELLGRDSIFVGGHVIWASVAGVVRMDGGRLLGAWSDGADALADAFGAATHPRGHDCADCCRAAKAVADRRVA